MYFFERALRDRVQRAMLAWESFRRAADGRHWVRVAVAHEQSFVLPTAAHAKMWDVADTGQFHGLFMGVNRHASPAINELRFAEADARALHALFADTLGDGSELLVGEDVTRSIIEARFQALADCGSGDVVVVSFRTETGLTLIRPAAVSRE